MDECRHFIDDDDSSYWEEDGVILKRWPRRMVEPEPSLDTGYDICFCDGCYFGTGPCFYGRE